MRTMDYKYYLYGTDKASSFKNTSIYKKIKKRIRK